MSSVGVLTDEHVPGPCIAVLRSIGYDVVRAKDELSEGSADRELLRYAAETGRVVLTCDTRFTVANGAVVTDHSGVIYGEQAVLKRRPEDAAGAIEEILTTIPPTDLRGAECYLTDWM